MLTDNDTYQRETLSEWPIQQPLTQYLCGYCKLEY